MKFKLKQAAHLGGHDLKPGVHETPDSVFKEKLFELLLKSEKIVMVEAPVQAPKKEEAPKPLKAPPVDVERILEEEKEEEPLEKPKKPKKKKKE